jgi:prevent-host-death family protein
MARGGRLDNSHLNGYLVDMAEYSIAEAKNNLPKLVDRAMAGEEVMITRRGKLVAHIVPHVRNARPDDAPKAWNDVEWIRKHRVTPKVPLDAGELLRAMRDDYRY